MRKPLVKEMSKMLNSCGLNPLNYGTTLQGWANQQHKQLNVLLGANSLKYLPMFKDAHHILVKKKHWNIIDEGPAVKKPSPVKSTGPVKSAGPVKNAKPVKQVKKVNVGKFKNIRSLRKTRRFFNILKGV